MSTTAAAVTRSVAAAEDIATPFAAHAANRCGIGFRQFQIVDRGASHARVPRARNRNDVGEREIRVTDESFHLNNVSEVVRELREVLDRA